MSDTGLDRFVSVAVAAETIGVSKATGYRMVDAQEVPFDGTVPVILVRGVKKVSLRRLAEWMNGRPIELEQAS